jgi:hypothetical protein
LGLGTIDQLDPFQVSTSVSGYDESEYDDPRQEPTAVHQVSEVHEIPAR